MLKGSKFQNKVWKEIKKIPKGKVTTYKNIAKKIGFPKASRAVANACGKNPYAPLIPCHRVIKSDFTIGGYSGKGGIRTKIKLLKKEKINIKKECLLFIKKFKHIDFITFGINNLNELKENLKILNKKEYAIDNYYNKLKLNKNTIDPRTW